MRRYAGSIYYTGAKLTSRNDMVNEDDFSPDLPELMEEPVRHDESMKGSSYKNNQFTHVLI